MLKNFSTLFVSHMNCHYVPFKKEAAHSADRFLETIRRNSALPRHSTVAVTRPSIAENRCTRGMRDLRSLHYSNALKVVQSHQLSFLHNYVD